MMDVSNAYIKMCKNAREIQKLFNMRDGDFFSNEKYVFVRTHHYGYLPNPMIWLPRQDQLQSIFGCIAEDCHDSIDEFLSHGYLDAIPGYWFRSMEQLWLAFCMVEKFNKIWNGEEWIIKQQ